MADQDGVMHFSEIMPRSDGVGALLQFNHFCYVDTLANKLQILKYMAKKS